MNTTSRSKKVLAPLAVLLAAGALAVGSGATFTSTSSNTVSSVTAGTLKHTNSKPNAAIFELDNLKPGKAQSGSVTITNTGTLDAKFSLTEPTSENSFTATQLGMKITEGAAVNNVWSGEFGALANDQKVDLGVIPAGESRTYNFEVLLKSHTKSNDDQGMVAKATYTWDSVQLDG